MSLIRYVTKIHFADGIIDYAVAAEIDALAVTRPLLVADSSTRNTGLLERVCDALPKKIEAVLFEIATPPPTIAAADLAASTYRETERNGIVALGSEAAIDLAKAIAVSVSHDGPIADYAASEGGVARINNVLPPLISIPTGGSAGSEVGTSAHLTDDARGCIELVSPFLVPRVAICDPTVAVDQPANKTAGAGMRALAQCIETYLSTAYNPPADGIALEGLKRAAASIEQAVRQSGDLDARRELMAAAINGALARQKGLGGVHAASQALGGLTGYDLDHGVLHAVLLPHVLRFNAPAVSDRYSALKQAMGLQPATSLEDGIAQLVSRIGLPSGLSDIGVDNIAIFAAAPLAERDHANGTNPRRASAADYRDIMYAAF